MSADRRLNRAEACACVHTHGLARRLTTAPHPQPARIGLDTPPTVDTDQTRDMSLLKHGNNTATFTSHCTRHSAHTTRGRTPAAHPTALTNFHWLVCCCVCCTGKRHAARVQVAKDSQQQRKKLTQQALDNPNNPSQTKEAGDTQRSGPRSIVCDMHATRLHERYARVIIPTSRLLTRHSSSMIVIVFRVAS
jgi:hypothetical protein